MVSTPNVRNSSPARKSLLLCRSNFIRDYDRDKPSSLIPRGSLAFDSRRLDDFCPLRDLVLDEGGVLLGGIADGVGAVVRQPGAQIRRIEGSHDLAVQLVDDGARRLGRRGYAIPGRHQES